MTVEVCANSVESALQAQQSGADRLEVCSELGIGGISPSYGFLKQIKEKITIPVHVLIRPRSGDFSYSDTDFEVMLSDIAFCKEMGFEGIVSGALFNDCTLDTERIAGLRKASEGMEFTFHRAFDWVKNPRQSLKNLEALGVDNILTSGQARSAIEGISLLKALLEEAGSSTIIPAAGIRPENAKMFKDAGFMAIHLSGVRMHRNLEHVPELKMYNPELIADDWIPITDPDLIRQVIKTVK